MSSFANGGAIQFENANSLRAYPFSEGTEFVSTDGRTPPEGSIVDLHLVVPFSATARAELASIHLSESMVSACVKIMDGDVVTAALSATIRGEDLVPYMPTRMEPLSGRSDAAGIVTFGDVELPSSPETYFFSGVQVHPCCVAMLRPPGVRKIVDPRSGEEASGDVDVGFSGYVSASRTGRSVKLLLADGAKELSSSCARDLPLNMCGAEPITSINGVKPDSSGTIVLWFH